MFLHVLLISIKHSTALTIGSYSLNYLIKAYLNILFAYLHFGTKIKKCVSNGRWYFLRLLVLEMVFDKVEFYHRSCSGFISENGLQKW